MRHPANLLDDKKYLDKQQAAKNRALFCYIQRLSDD